MLFTGRQHCCQADAPRGSSLQGLSDSRAAPTHFSKRRPIHGREISPKLGANFNSKCFDAVFSERLLRAGRLLRSSPTFESMAQC